MHERTPTADAPPTPGVCIVGTARRTWRGPDAAPEPLAMWETMVRAAAADVPTRRDVVAALDHVAVVHCLSWEYDDPAGRLAERLGRPEVGRSTSILAGTSPQRLVDRLAAAMARGEIGAAVVVGAEAEATRHRFADAGDDPPWSHRTLDPPSLHSMLDEWYLPTELRHGVTPAWLTFALLEQARWAGRGADPYDRQRLGAQMAELSRVAARNPDAWFDREWSAAELLAGGPGNRRVATPYTKAMTAFPTVDMAAANLLVTTEVADAWGVPDAQRVHLRGSGFARDASHVAGRDDLTASGAMVRATRTALQRSGLHLDDVDGFDLYSCFGAAVSFARDALGLADVDPRPVTLTGGLPYHGGPGSNYMSHSISHAVTAIRAGVHRHVMVTGVGMHMTKHVAAVWSAEPGPAGPGEVDPQQTVTPDDPVRIADTARGTVAVEAATVVYDRADTPAHAVAICRLPDGRRCYARSTDPAVLTAVADDKWVDVTATLDPGDDGTMELLV